MRSKHGITSTNFLVETVLWSAAEAVFISEKAGWAGAAAQGQSAWLQKAGWSTSVYIMVLVLNSSSAQGFALSSPGSRRWMCRKEDANLLIYITNVTTRWRALHICLSKVSQERGVESHILGSSLFEQIKGRGVKCVLLCLVAPDSAVLLHLSLTWAGPASHAVPPPRLTGCPFS